MNRGLRGFAILVFAFGALGELLELIKCIQWTVLYVSGRADVAKKNVAMELEMDLRRIEGAPNCARYSCKMLTWYLFVLLLGAGFFTGGLRTKCFGGLLAILYMIVMTELMVARNTNPSGSPWSFGQTIALVMVGQQLMDCASYAKQEWRNRKEPARQANLPNP